jgi:hypothetical protein
MNKRIALSGVLFALGVSVVIVAMGQPQGRGATVHASLDGIQEVPSLFTSGHGSFRARIDERAGTITYELTYQDLRAPVTQAHLHFGEQHTNGGVIAFLCTNVGGPPGTQACPPAPAEITGVITAADVIGPEGQGLAAGDFSALLDALRAGAVYVNVHSELFLPGEIRGQID